MELVRERAWRMGLGAEVQLWVFATVTNTATVLTLLGSVHPLLLVLPLLGAARIWSAYLSSTRQQKAWEDSLPQERLIDRLNEVAKDPRTGLELRVFGLAYAVAVIWVVARARDGQQTAGDVVLVLLLAPQVDQMTGGIRRTCTGWARSCGASAGTTGCASTRRTTRGGRVSSRHRSGSGPGSSRGTSDSPILVRIRPY